MKCMKLSYQEEQKSTSQCYVATVIRKYGAWMHTFGSQNDGSNPSYPQLRMLGSLEYTQTCMCGHTVLAAMHNLMVLTQVDICWRV